MNRRAAALIVVLASVSGSLSASTAGALVEAPAGWVHEIQSEYGWARLDGTDDGLLVARRDRIERHRSGGAVELVAAYVAPQLVAWDPTTDDAIFTNADAEVRRLHVGVVSTIADFSSVSGLDVAPDGTIVVAHAETQPQAVVSFVSTISVDGVVTRLAGGGSCDDACKRAGAPALTASLDYLTGVAVERDGDVLVAENRLLHRVEDGVLRTVAGSGRWCAPPDPCGDGGAAIDAGFAEITSLVADVDGSIYLTEHRASRIRVIRPDGIVHNLAGSFQSCLKVQRTDCIPAFGALSAVQPVVSIALSAGDLFAIDEHSWTRLLQVTRVAEATPVLPQGYRMIASDGGVFTFGWSPFHGSTGDLSLVSPISAGTSNGARGYWFVAGDGGVFTFGDAGFFGSAVGRTTSPVVDVARTPTGLGYWLLERNGRVHAFGDVPHRGDGTPPTATHSAAAIIGARSGDGYRIVRTDGTQEDRQDQIGGQPASFTTLNRPIVHARPTPSGNGLWLVASDGGVFTQGDAGFFGFDRQPAAELAGERPRPDSVGPGLLAHRG